MVTKSRKNAAKKKVKTLNLKKETVKTLTGEEAKRVKGGLLGTARLQDPTGNITSKFSGIPGKTSIAGL